MTENTVLPLINTAFEPGNARKAAESFADRDFREIAIAEFYYFTGQAQKCSDLVEIYIMSSRLELKLSACMLYVYSNLTLGNAKASERGLEIIRECLRKEMEAPTSERNTAYCVFAGYMGTVLLHLSTEELPDMKKYMSSLPQGLRIFAANVISHDLYLKGEKTAINDIELAGYELFKKYDCATCHIGETLGGQSYELMGVKRDYFADRGIELTEEDNGRFKQTRNERDKHRFKVPGLRNIALTAPYFHDGSMKTMKEAVDYMAKYQMDLNLPEDELNKIVAFLETLTGEYKGKPLTNDNQTKAL